MLRNLVKIDCATKKLHRQRDKTPSFLYRMRTAPRSLFTSYPFPLNLIRNTSFYLNGKISDEKKVYCIGPGVDPIK